MDACWAPLNCVPAAPCSPNENSGSSGLGAGVMSFAYGLTHEEAGSYLKLPEGKKLMRSGTDLALADL